MNTTNEQHRSSESSALAWSWHSFTRNFATLLVPTAVYAAAVPALIAMALVVDAWADDSATYPHSPSASHDFAGAVFSYFSSTGNVVTVLGFIALFVVAAAIQSAYLGGMLDLAAGRPVTVGSFFRPRHVGRVVVASLLVTALTAIGLAWFVVPGLIVGIFSMFTIVALIDRDLSPTEAIRASVAIVKANLGRALLAALLVYVLIAIGTVTFAGVLVTYPVAALLLVRTYRALPFRNLTTGNSESGLRSPRPARA